MSKLSSVTRSHVFSSLAWAVVAMCCVMVIGTVGYHFIGGSSYTWLDCFYMTFVTVSTIGFSEIIDFSHHPAGRVFTMFIATAGIATLTFMLSVVTAFILEGDLNQKWRRKKMQKTIDELSDHYIICGVGRVGGNVAHEMAMTERQLVLIDSNRENIEGHLGKYSDQLYLVGDATDNDVLIAAGVERARGIFAVAHDDTINLVICLSARQLNPKLRIIARCHEMKNADKTRRAGADEIVSPDFTGGLRLVSAMVRPHVVSFLDEMLKTDNNLRMEEAMIPDHLAGKPLSELYQSNQDCLVLAVQHHGQWKFNPAATHVLQVKDVLMMMTTPVGRDRLQQLLAGT